MKSLLCLFFLSLPLSAAVSISLPGSTEKATWNLSTANYPSATYNSFGTAANPWGAAAAPTSGTASAFLDKVSGSGYMSGSGFMYTAGTNGAFRIYDDSPLASLQTIVFQANSSGDTLTPTLNYNGGGQALVANYFMLNDNASPAYDDYVWQWDLSEVVGAITSYEILFNGHFAATSMTLDTGSSFTQAVPEPSFGVMGIAALGLTLIRRRRA